MVALVVYADILILLNFLVDYFLLLATTKVLRYKIKTFRLIAASIFGGLTSLTIFLPKITPTLELVIKLILCFLTVVIAFKYDSIKLYLKAFILFFIITSGYAGLMMAIWRIFKPNGLIINNSVVYMQISPLVLVACTTVTYLIFIIFNKIFAIGNKVAEDCEITVFAEEKSVMLHALIDTGNSIEDIFGKSEIIIADISKIEYLFGKNFEENLLLKSRFRVIPFNTVSGIDMLNGIRCDKAIVYKNNAEIILEKPILAASKVPLRDEYNALVNPRIFY